jgi:uncharacterized protein
MLPDLEKLIRLQAIDTKIFEARRQLTLIPERQQALSLQLEHARTEVAAAKERLAENQTVRRAIEKDLSAVQTRLSRYKDQLMEVKTNREYHAMQHEIETAQAEVRRFEDQMLERMLESDELASRLKEAEVAVAGAERHVKEQHSALDKELQDVQASLDTLVAEREVLAHEVPPAALAMFEQVGRARKGLAVAEARDGLCTVCQMRIRPQVFNEVRRNAALIQCDSCQRILFFAATIPATGASAPSP